VTLQSPIDDRYNYPEDYLRAKIAGALGGRAAEKLVYGVITTGAENDIQQVTRLARDMVTRWGMSPKLGPINYDPDSQDGRSPFAQSSVSEDTARTIDEEARRIVDECFELATSVLETNRQTLDRLVQALLREESLDEDQVLAVVGEKPAPARP
jgi:cell division protease FtsH